MAFRSGTPLMRFPLILHFCSGQNITTRSAGGMVGTAASFPARRIYQRIAILMDSRITASKVRQTTLHWERNVGVGVACQSLSTKVGLVSMPEVEM